LMTIFSSAYNDEFPSIFSLEKEYGKQLLDYASEEVDNHFKEDEDSYHDQGLLDSITNIKKQLK